MLHPLVHRAGFLVSVIISPFPLLSHFSVPQSVNHRKPILGALSAGMDKMLLNRLHLSSPFASFCVIDFPFVVES